MAKKKLKKTMRIILPKVTGYDFDVHYKNYTELNRFLTERGRIVGRKRSSLNSKEQRILSREIKRARHLALLPYTSNLSN
jgi:small subunit ribosomal protein S18